MTDVLESDQGTGTPAQPGQGASVNGGSSTSNDLEGQLKELRDEISRIKRESQSVKDKRISGIEKEMGDYRDVLKKVKELTESGLTFDQAQREIEFDQIRNKVLGPKDVPASGGTRNDEPADETMVLIESAGFDKNDPDVLKLLLNDPSPAKLQGGLIKLGIERASKPIPSAATVAAPAGGNAPDQSPAELESTYRKEVMSARGNKNAILEIQSRYQKKGLDTSQVVFTV